MNAGAVPIDFRVVLHNTLPMSYEASDVLLARVGQNGTLQLLTSGWERVLGYASGELNGKMLRHLMWSDGRRASAAVAAILDDEDTQPVELRVRCGDGVAKCFRLHRRYDSYEHIMYLLAEETAAQPATTPPARQERRAAVRRV